MARCVLGQMGEEVTEDGFEGWNGERDERGSYLGVLDAHHGIVEPAAIGFPLTVCDEPDAHCGDYDYAGGGVSGFVLFMAVALDWGLLTRYQGTSRRRV